MSVVIPARNEEQRLPRTLTTLLDTFPLLEGERLELVVVDDGSTDNTAAVARTVAPDDLRLLVVRRPPMGKGRALQEGFAQCTGARVAFLDADLPIDVHQLRGLLDALERADVVAATRVGPDAGFVVPQPLARRLGGRAFRLAIRLLGLASVSDPQCGAKALRRPAADPVVAACRSPRFGFDAELLARARRSGLRVTELGVRWTHVGGSTLRPFNDALTTIRDLAAVRRELSSR